jgi:trimethylamine--corrinoid protein Co-methyltransferase
MMPTFRVLSDDEMVQVHEASVRLLGKTGVRVEHEGARKMLLKAGATKAKGPDIIKIPETLVEECMDLAPSGITLKGRGGKREVVLEGDRVNFNPGSAAMFIRDYETYDIRPSTTEDLRRFVLLTDALEFMAMQSTALVASDVPKALGDIYRLYVVLCNSDKPVVTGAFGADGVPPMNALLMAAGQGENKAPMAIFDCCSTAPMMWGDIPVQNLLDCADLGIPAELITMPELGATSPATIAGAIVQGNAEFLSGLVMAQLRRKGAPVIYGGSATTFDMRFATPRLGSVETAMLATGLAQMGRSYKVPTHAYLALSDSKTVDAQAGLETMIGALIGVLAGINNISGPGMLSSENCQSLEKLVIDNDICGMALRLGRGVQVDAETLAEDLISQYSPGGNFLANKHTLKWFRTETFMPSAVIDRQVAKKWKDGGSKDAARRAGELAEKIIKEKPPAPLEKGMAKDLTVGLLKAAEKRAVKASELPLR